MLKINILFLLIAFASSQVGLANADKKLTLMVYYESLCPDSKSFIVNELKPAVDFMQDNLIVKLIPFGKAYRTNQGLQCQHGPAECFGNLVQDCVLNIMSSRTDAEKVDYVACEMETRAGSRGDLQCAQKANMPTMSVQNCVSSVQGANLQQESEFYTKMLQPHFIPTVTMNGVFNQEIQDNAMKDLIGTICQFLRNTKTCTEYYNAQALISMMG